VLNYGTRPTFEATGFPGAAVPEVFILDFESNLYGQTLEIIFHPRLRPEHPFESVEALKKQIEEDIAKARRYFHSLPKKTFTTIAD
jgi:riboflavin kinase/FMN adenylyltransferase